jgi:hypothetical protein
MQPRNQQIRLLAVLVMVLILVWGGFSLYNSLTFHVVKTDPSLGAVSKYSPFIKVYFNKTLNPASLKVSDLGGILSSSSVNGKVVTLKFARDLTVNKKYSVSIDHVRATSGDTITNYAINFTAQNISVDKLSKDQQKFIIANQDKIPYSVYAVTYTNFSALTDQGVSSGQLQNIETALFNYSESIHKQFWTMVLNQNSLNIVFQDPTARDAADLASSATFTVSMGGQNYTVRTEYTGLDDNTYTRIYDASGTQVFDNTADN